MTLMSVLHSVTPVSGLHLLTHSTSRKGYLLIKVTRFSDRKECVLPINIPTHGYGIFFNKRCPNTCTYTHAHAHMPNTKATHFLTGPAMVGDSLDYSQCCDFSRTGQDFCYEILGMEVDFKTGRIRVPGISHGCGVGWGGVGWGGVGWGRVGWGGVGWVG